MKRLLALLAPLALALCLMAFSAPRASALDYGLAAAGSQPVTDYEMEAVDRSGATYWRLGLDCFGWYSNQSGVWQDWDAKFKLAWERGIKVLPTLSSRCTATSIDLPWKSEWEPANSPWQNFAAAVVAHYGINGSFWSGKSNPLPVQDWEIQNEPNLAERGQDGIASGSAYAPFFQKTAETLQAAQGSFYTTHSLVGGLYYEEIKDGPSKTPHTFMQEMANYPSVKPWVYGVAIHPYEFGANSNLRIWEDITAARSDVNTYLGSNKPLWITEIGWPVEGHNVGVPYATLSEQAGAVHDLFNWVQQEASGKNIQALIFYMYRDDALGEGHWAHFCGLREARPAEWFSRATFRPAWYAFQEEVGAAKWPVAPGAETQAATSVQATEATLNGVINPHNLPTGYHFEWGTVENSYSFWAPGSDQDAGWKEGNISENYVLTGLKPGTTYHYRIVGTNENHEIVGGANKTFTTGLASPASIVDSDGVTHVYYRGQNNQLNEYYQEGSAWRHKALGYTGVMGGDPVAIQGPGKRRWVYFRGSKGELRSWWFEGPNWNEQSWGFENKMAGDPAVVETPAGRRWLYFKGPNGEMKSWWFEGSGWSEDTWGSTGKVFSDPAAVETSAGKRWVYFKGPNGELGSRWFEGSSSTGEQSWGSTGKVFSDPAAVETSAGKRWVYFNGPSNELRGWWFEGASSGEQSWGSANSMGGEPVAIKGSGSKHWIYYKGPSGELRSRWFEGASSTEQSWGSTGKLGSRPAPVFNRGRGPSR